MGVRILVVGAGGIGGYFGGRLLGSGRDVTFLVRARRAAQLARTGLVIHSPLGDLDLPAPPTITAGALRAADMAREPFDVILLTVKAYDLGAAMDDFAPAVGPRTLILPLLNGMRHLDRLDERFGADRVLGGWCAVSTTLDAEGRIVHLDELAILAFGACDGSRSERLEAIAAALSDAGFEAQLSKVIVQEMWVKWVTVATGAGITCLMRAAIGDIVAAGAGDLSTALLDECAAIAAQQGHALSLTVLQDRRAWCTSPGSQLTASMLRDIERGAPIEAEQILGDLLRRDRRGEGTGTASLLRIAYAHLKSYEARRSRAHTPGVVRVGTTSEEA
jgi:2-dehydropantoate 2-reductase